MRSVLADFSRVVRESTIKRLTLTPKSFENWKITENAMSIADIAQHLVAIASRSTLKVMAVRLLLIAKRIYYVIKYIAK